MQSSFENKNQSLSYLSDWFGVSKKTIELYIMAESELKERFSEIDDIAAYNQLKVLKAFQNNRISYAHFGETTGYGYDDMGRDALDKVYAEIVGAEDAMVRHNIVSGTQAISACLFGVLRPGDILASVVGAPYDTMEEVIGIREGEYPDTGSLKDFGVDYRQVDLIDGEQIDYDAIEKLVSENKIKAVLIQRSRGYDWRSSLTVSEIGRIIKTVKDISPETLCIVDNCYGIFVEKEEPTEYGADLIVGSLIKNAGGSLALSGGYIAGTEECVRKVGYRLTAPGLGKHVGASLGMNRNMYQGLFMAPNVVSESIKTAVLCAAMFEKLGFDVCPGVNSVRSDIIQAVKLNTPENVIKFCQAIQKGSPIDSYVTPEPWDMPGYESQVIMAAGAFVQGASIELSADAPIEPPYTAYMQGGVIYNSAKIGILKAADEFIDNIKG